MIMDENSCECLLSELDLFQVPPTQTSVEKSVYKVYHPVNAITGNAPLEFHVGGTDEDYLDINQQSVFYSIFNHATSRPHGYLFCDGTQTTPDYARFRTNIFDEVQRVYIVEDGQTAWR